MPNFLSEEQVFTLRLAHSKIKEKQLADRIKAILALNEGLTYEEVEKLLLLDEVTVRRHLKMYKKKGVKGLLEMRYKGGQTKLGLLQESELKKYLEENTKRTSKEIVDYIFEKYKVKFSVIGATKLLHRLGFSYKKPKIVPGKADFFNQAQFIEKYDEIKNNLKTNDQIYFVDSTHPEHNTKPSYGWILKGKLNDKIIKTNSGRERLNLAGALNLNSKEALVLSEKTINKFVTIKLIKKLQKLQPTGKIYMILDNASYYHANLVTNYVKMKRRIKLIFLPSYSPNLNIIERLWKFFHQKITYNHYFETFKEFKKESLKFFRNMEKYKPELNTLLTDNFQLLPT